jgi:hypothetical protein
MVIIGNFIEGIQNGMRGNRDKMENREEREQ